MNKLIFKMYRPGLSQGELLFSEETKKIDCDYRQPNYGSYTRYITGLEIEIHTDFIIWVDGVDEFP